MDSGKVSHATSDLTVPKVLQEGLPAKVEKIVPNAIHDNCGADIQILRYCKVTTVDEAMGHRCLNSSTMSFESAHVCMHLRVCISGSSCFPIERHNSDEVSTLLIWNLKACYYVPSKTLH